MKNSAENCTDKLSNNNNLNFKNMNINRNTSISSYSSSIENTLEFNQQHYLRNNHRVIDKRSSMDEASSESISNNLNYIRKKETLVEKKPNVDKESPSGANTFLLNGDALNDLNDFYSLKITFV